MEESRQQTIAELKDRIFLLQIEERRLCAVLTSQRKEQVKAEARKGIKDRRDAIAKLTADLARLEAEARRDFLDRRAF
jgi:hypothetical protein